jgi:hypothetical protein
MRIHSPQITGSAENTNIVTVTRITSLSALSASFASTASSADNLTVRGTLTAQTINVQTITSSIDYVTGSSINGSLLANTHQFTGSVSITGSLAVNESNVILTNQTSSMSVATASYWSGSIINSATASYVENAQSASYVQNAQTASYVIQAQSASYWSGSIINAATASYVENAQSASYVLQAQSASYWSGSITNAATASYVLNAVSASFALTASYISGSGGGVGFPFSGSAIITGSLFVSGSTISGSFVGNGSGITGLTAGGKIHTQTSAASTWTVSHNLGVQYPNVTVYDNNNNVIIPQTITATDTNTLTLTFGSAVAGYAVAGIGGIINVQGRTTQQYFTTSTTWSFAHNLGDKYVSLQAFDDAFEMVIPTTIRLVDFTSSLLLFDSASSGYAVATIGGDLPAISSSYAGYTLQVANSAPYSASWVSIANTVVTTAQTASYANNFTVGGTLTAQTINVQTITSSIEYVTGSTRNGSLLTNTHQFTGSLYISSSNASLLSVNNSMLFVSSSGNVGIGTTTPLSTLVVSATNSGGRGGEISITNPGTAANSEAALNFGFGTSTYNGDAGNAQIKALMTNVNEATDIVFSNWSGAAYNERMRITSGGNVGIGISSPVSNDGDSRTFQLGNRLVVQNVIGSQFLIGTNTYYDGVSWKYIAAAKYQAVRGTGESGGIQFHLASAGTAGGTVTNMDSSDIKMIIKESGNVGIGTISPSVLLHVSGTIYATKIGGTGATPAIQVRGLGGGPRIQTYGLDADSRAWMGLGTDMAGNPYEHSLYFPAPDTSPSAGMQTIGSYDGTTYSAKMTILRNGSIGAPTGTNIYNPSDVRLKQNISTTTYGLSTISALNPVKFNWIDNFVESENGKDMLGFIAQEVQTVIPEAIESFGSNIDLNGTTIENPLRVNEKFIIPVLVKAIQELSAKVAALENK